MLFAYHKKKHDCPEFPLDRVSCESLTSEWQKNVRDITREANVIHCDLSLTKIQ